MTTHAHQLLLRALAFLVLVSGMTGCALYEDLEPIGPAEVTVESVTVTPEMTTIDVGETVALDATVLGSDGEEMEDRTVEWESSNPNRATVSSSGVVEGLMEGTVTITARVEGVSGTAEVEVLVPIDDVTVEPSQANLEVGQTQQFTATVLDVEGNVVDSGVVDWSSSNEDVATVDGSGLVTAQMEGTSTIQAAAGGVSGTATVTVTASVADVEISPDPAMVALGDTTQLTATLTDVNGNELSGRDVTWESDDESIATVNSNGIVSGISEGDVDIMATSEGESGTALVQVTRPVASVSVTPDPVTLDVAETEQLTAVARDANGNDIQLQPDAFTWRSADQSIATVTGSGLVEGTGEGTVDVSAEVDGVSDASQITVNRPVVSIEISPSTASVEVGNTVQLSATLLDANDDVISGRSVTWSSSDPNVASVDSSGTVTGQQEGNVEITARAEGVSAIADVAVGAPVDNVEISPDGGSVDVGDDLQLSATVEDAQGNTLPRTVTWSSSDSSVASVDSSGLVTGESEGTADITAESEGVTDEVTVTVTASVASVTISPTSVSLDLNQTQQLTATLRDVNGNELTGRTVNWSSADSSIASVDNSGVVTANGEGSTMITAESEGQTDSVSVTVTASVANVEVTPDSVRIYSDEQAQLNVEVQDANGDSLTGRTVTWSSDDTAVATVDSSGMVTAVAPGEVNISAESEGESDTTAVTVVEWAHVDAGQKFTCGVLTDGTAYCWGENDTGEIGNGTTGGTFTEPEPVQSTQTFVEISSGYFHNCGLTTNQEIYCWGEGGNGSLGDGGTTQENAPVKVSGAYSFSDVSVGANHSCGLESGGDILCWGIQQDGQLGTGNTQDSVLPQSVAGSQTWVDVAAGLKHTCGLTDNGLVYCWGDNSKGQLGTGDYTSTIEPTTAVAGGVGTNAVAVGVGAEHSCAVLDTGDVYCWGSNSNGQLSLDPNGTADSNTPVQVTGTGATFESTELGFNYSCAIATSGDVYCWGFNGQGNFGNGAPNVAQFDPVTVGGGHDWSVIGAGLQHTCGINQLVDAHCFGDNDHGEIGNGTTSNVVQQPTPVNRPPL